MRRSDFYFIVKIIDYTIFITGNCISYIIMFQAYPMTKFNKQNRSFNASYYCFEWLEYSILNDALYCYACRNYGCGSNNEEIFTKIGFRKWNKVEIKDFTTKYIILY